MKQTCLLIPQRLLSTAGSSWFLQAGTHKPSVCTPGEPAGSALKHAETRWDAAESSALALLPELLHTCDQNPARMC